MIYTWIADEIDATFDSLFDGHAGGPMRTIRRRFWIEIIAAIACGLLAIVTVFWRDWIELSGWDPDDHNGSAEWFVVAALAVISVVAGVLARFEWRRPALAT